VQRDVLSLLGGEGDAEGQGSEYRRQERTGCVDRSMGRRFIFGGWEFFVVGYFWEVRRMDI
jgi:hypothetical protein